MSRIVSIGTAVPMFQNKQKGILEFMHDAYHDEIASRRLNVLFHHSGITTRYSVLSDFDLTNENHILFNGNIEPPKVEQRLNVFKEKAIPLAHRAISDSLEKLGTSLEEIKFTHLITVTCTGLHAPGLDAELMELLHLPDDIFHLAINFLGCNAAFHALKLGNMIANTDENAKVLIVCVELCTLHFQPKNNTDNLLSNTIFGDGAAAVIITSDSISSGQQYPGFFMDDFYSLVFHHGKDLMGWNITPVNFEMILDTSVPEFLGDEMIAILLGATNKFNIKPETIKHWAIHPGGKKILDTIRKQLNLSEIDLQASYNILNSYGNMSSPTILFVLEEMMQHRVKLNDTVFSMGFGPGLSIETSLFTYVQ